MTPPQLIRALFHDQALVENLLAAEPSTEEILRTYRDLGALARFAWRPFMNNPKLERRLRRISAPTRVVAAEHDRIVPRAHCERYAAKIPDAELLVLEGCGHAMHQERPEAVASAVTEFLTA
jgi:pimeloyl-ACP methyl ester carboxylesterase